MAAWHEPPRDRSMFAPLAFVLYVGLWCGLVGIILWKLWTEYNLGGIVP